MIKETFTFFLSHQQPSIDYNQKQIPYQNQTEAEREIHAAKIVQVNDIFLIDGRPEFRPKEFSARY